MEFGVLTRREAGTNKCPKCCQGNVTFMVLSEHLLACFDCGCVFVKKEVKDRFRRGLMVSTKVEPVVENTTSVVEVTTPLETTITYDLPEPKFKCDVCGKEVKTKLALAGHKRSHKNG